MLAALDIEVVWDGTKAHNGGLLMAAAEDTKMAKKELITKGEDGWGFETLDGRKAGFPSRDAARAARKEWMEADAEKKEQEMEEPKAGPITTAINKAAQQDAVKRLEEAKQVAPEPVINGTPVIAPKTPSPVMPSGRKRVTPDEVTAVLNLRAAGMSFQRIEAELGWDDFHGCKARRIVLDAAAAHALAAKHAGTEGE